MFFHDGGKLQYPVRVDRPNPLFARMLQQAIGGVEGEIRVAMQYLFQAWGSRGPKKYRDILLETATEEISHVEMLATAVALNLEGAPTAIADMYSNVCAEATGRALAVRLHNMTDDAGMRDMLQFLIARDTMHQNQWLAIIEELGGETEVVPIPNTHPRTDENAEFSYVFLSTSTADQSSANSMFAAKHSPDGKGLFSAKRVRAMGEVPVLAPPVPGGGAQAEQMQDVE